MQKYIHQIVSLASEVLVDKANEIEKALICILSEGHLLIEDLPGVGKTTLVQVLAKLMGLQGSRIQFTNDLLPADVLGNMILDSESRTFKFHKGPVFAQLVLADELNRASPRTQSALLQAMEESEVTIDGHHYPLPEPFCLIATQNPRSQIGTSPLPESQLDRFLMSLEMSFASPNAEQKIIQGHDARDKIKHLVPIINSHQLIEMQGLAAKVHVSDKVAQYIGAILQHSRKRIGLNPLSIRAGMALANASRSCAFVQGRDHVLPDDVQKIATEVLAHRLGGQEGVAKGRGIAHELLHEVPALA
ncbi:MAG: AAA family ATPase [Bdellovibrionaceae bacterium]|nr:AAA family ATPase [Pseudobdellovibrionaceae bacterium]